MHVGASALSAAQVEPRVAPHGGMWELKELLRPGVPHFHGRTARISEQVQSDAVRDTDPGRRSRSVLPLSLLATPDPRRLAISSRVLERQIGSRNLWVGEMQEGETTRETKRDRERHRGRAPRQEKKEVVLQAQKMTFKSVTSPPLAGSGGRVTWAVSPPPSPLPAAMNHLLGRDLRDGIVAAGLRWRIVCIAEGIRTISCNLCNASPLILNTKLTDELPGHDSAMQPRRKKPRGAVTGESPGGLLVLAGLASSARHSVRPSAGWRRQQVECNRC